MFGKVNGKMCFKRLLVHNYTFKNKNRETYQIIQSYKSINWPHTFQYLFQFFGLALAIFYFLFSPSGKFGIFLTLSSLIAVSLSANKKTLGVYLLLLGPPVFGAIFQSFNIKYVGAALSLSLGFILLFISKSKYSALKACWRSPIAWLLLTVIVLSVSYFLGPQTEYSQKKLIFFTLNLLLTIVAILLIVKHSDVDIWKLGLLGIISSVVYYCAILYSFQDVIVPQNIWFTGALRISSAFSETAIATNTIALISSSGIVFLLSSILDKKSSNLKITLSIFAVFIGYIVLNAAGQRLFLTIPPIAALTLILCRPIKKKFYRIIFSVIITLSVFIVWSGLQSENRWIVSLFQSDRAFSEKINRSINWNAAVSRIQEEPLLGHGLGGYYIDGFSYPGSGTYPHNLFLELLCETGVIGTILILIPVLFLLLSTKNK